MCRKLILFYLTTLILLGNVTPEILKNNTVSELLQKTIQEEQLQYLTNFKSLEQQKTTNASSNYYLFINVLKDLNLLEHYLNKKNLTSASSEFNQLSLRSKLEEPETYLTKLSVFYSSQDSLTCTDIPKNITAVKCVDDILEKKLKMKLSNLYEIELQPLIVNKDQLRCTSIDSELKTNEFYCYLPTKSETSRRKLVWKLLLFGNNKNSNVEPRSSKNLNESSKSFKDNSSTKETDFQVDNEVQSRPKQDEIKDDLLNISQPIDNFFKFVTTNKIIMCIALIFGVGLTVLANTVMCLMIRKRKIKPLSINTMSLSNRLLQNYLDVSLISDAKISSTSITKSANTPKSNTNQREDGPTPLRSSTSVEQNYAASSKHSPAVSQKNLRNFNLNENNNKFTSNEEDFSPSTNPYNSLSCMTVSEKAHETKPKKLKYSVSSIGIQADLPTREYCARTQSMNRHYSNGSSRIYRKNYEDAESQIMCIEMDRNNMYLNQTISEDYISVADLYQLANKHLDQSASVKVNDYSAFKNSLNFQLQAAKAAAIAENLTVNQKMSEEDQIEEIVKEIPIRMSTSIISINKTTSDIAAFPRRSSSILVRSGQNSIDEESEKSSSSSSSIAPYSSASQFLAPGHTTREEEESEEDMSSSSNESDFPRNIGWTTLNETVQTENSKHHGKENSFRHPSTSSKNMYLNDMYMAIDGSDMSRLKTITPMEGKRPIDNIDPRDEITFLTRIQDSTINTIYDTKNKLEEAEIEMKSLSLEKSSQNWTTVSVSSPSVVSLIEAEAKRTVNEISNQIQGQKTGYAQENRLKYGENRPVKIIQNSSHQYQKLYNLNKMITKNL